MDKITIIGTGLIGTSLGMALKKAQIKAEIVGSDRDRGIANRAQKMGGADSTESNPIRAVKGAKVVVIATPIMTIEEIMKLIGPELDEGCVVTDTGSTKASVLKWAEEHLPSKVSFVGGHPMAGKEISGPDAAPGRPLPGRDLLPYAGQRHRGGRPWLSGQYGGGRWRKAVLHRPRGA